MEERNPSAGQSALYYGLLLSVAVIVMHLILYIADAGSSTVGTILSLVVLIIGVAYFQYDYRNKKWGGYISYGKAVKIGFLTMLFASFIVAVYTYLYHSQINPAEIQQTKLDSLQQIYNYGLSPEAEAQQVKLQEMIHTPLVYSLASIPGYAIIGLIIALITAIFIKKEETTSLS
ncbi:MAG: DUF4199 domain-containing protein [Bacteroidota bacterium]